MGRLSSCTFPSAGPPRTCPPTKQRKPVTDTTGGDTGPVKQLRLLVVDDHEVVRQGLVALLDRRPGSRSSPRPARSPRRSRQARQFRPDIVVMDVRLPDGSGIEACREIRAELPGDAGRHAHLYPDEEAVLSAIVAGASRLPAQADPGARPGRGAREPSDAASRCSTRPSPRRSSSASGGSPPATYRTSFRR